MRLAYVSMDRGVRAFGSSGSAIHVQSVLRHLDRAGIRVHLFTRRRGGDPPDDLSHVRVHRLPKPPKGDVAMKELGDLEANADLRHALEKAGPFGAVYERQSLWSRAGMEYAQTHGVPGVLEVNAPLLREQRRYRKLIYPRRAAETVSATFAAASALVAVSDGVAHALRGHPALTAPIHVIPNGVDIDRFADRSAGDVDRPFTIGFVGTLKPWHGVDGLLDAFAIVHAAESNTRLVIIGDGPERDALEQRAIDLGIDDAVHFAGIIEHAAIPSTLAGIDVAVAPYPPLEDFYFSPLKVFEYMAASKPVVASAVGQLQTLITPGVNGLLYPAGDIHALARSLGSLIRDEPMRRRLGEAARDLMVREHSWSAVTDRILRVIRSCRQDGRDSEDRAIPTVGVRRASAETV